MISSVPLPSAGCAEGNHQNLAGGSAKTSCAESAPEPVTATTAGTGVLPDEAEASKSQPTPPATLRELEAALRGLGFSRKQAANIAQHGFKAAQPEPMPDDSQILSAALKKFHAALQN